MVRKTLSAVLVLGSLVLAFTAVSAAAAGGAARAAQGDNGLVQVEAKYVCMVNNQRYDKEQIAIEVEKATYYGCCDMCKEKLRNDPKSRFAVDPVSGKKVNKAKAVIGASSDGKVYYFESVANMKKFKAA